MLITTHTADERLVWLHRRGDPRAREMLIRRYLPLARRLTLHYRRGLESADDLVQVASLGLVKAVDRWDPDRGLAFSSFAVPTILGELRRYFRDATWAVRPPRDLQELWLSVEGARRELTAATGREPTAAELAVKVGRSREQVEESLRAGEGRSALSLDMPLGDEEGEAATAADLIGRIDPGYARVEARATLQPLNVILDAHTREVLRLRFEEGLFQFEIGERLGCSQMQVSRMIGAALDKLYLHASAGRAA
jgi:RNA polymerase sigma-B factor